MGNLQSPSLPLQRPPSLTLYSLGFETTTFAMRLAGEQLARARQGTKVENVQWAILNMWGHHSGACKCYFYW